MKRQESKSATPQLRIKTKYIVDSDLWRLFPTIEVPYTDGIPSDYPGAMGVPMSALDKINYRGCDRDFELLATLRPVIDRKPLYQRLIIRNLHPTLPEEVDLIALLHQWGVEVGIENINAK